MDQIKQAEITRDGLLKALEEAKLDGSGAAAIKRFVEKNFEYLKKHIAEKDSHAVGLDLIKFFAIAEMLDPYSSVAHELYLGFIEGMHD